MIAFSASVNGKSSLWVRRLDGSAARLLPDTENAGQPFWSPDSKSIAFVIPGAGHNDTYVTGGEAYWKAWVKFLGGL